MGMIERDNATFDTTIKAHKIESITSFIFATHNIKKEITDKKSAIAENLKNSYEIFKHGSSSYKPNIGTFESHYTLGLEMGVWENTDDFKLSELAKRVANLEITAREYLDIVFLNLFGYYRCCDGDFNYKHFLYEVLNYLKENRLIEKENNKNILGEPFDCIFQRKEGYKHLDGKSEDTIKQQLNSLFNYLTDTDYFTLIDNKTFKVSDKWRDRVDELIEMCNLKYASYPKDVVQEKFKKNQKRNANYLTSIPENIEIVGGITLTKNMTVSKNRMMDETNTTSMHGKNKIYFGAPGTGKSHKVTEEIEKEYPGFNNQENYESMCVFRTTLHPEYTYNDFVGQLLPDVEGDNVKYTFQTGIFTDALTRAISMPEKQIFLVLEELSRANVSAVFGDLFQLLDRDSSGQSEYAINNTLIAKCIYDDKDRKIRIPKNLTIFGTVNTNDQNVFVMDTAFKRRFEWEYISAEPVENLNNSTITVYKKDQSILKVEWNTFYPALNNFITNEMKLSEDKQIGQFFIKFSREETGEENRNQFKNKLLQYLWEDIQEISFDHRLFLDSITSFGNCYERFNKNECLFSDTFIEKLEYSQNGNDYGQEVNE